MSIMPEDGSFDSRNDESMQSAYQVGQVDEHGFINLGIEECKVQTSTPNLNRSMSIFSKAGFGVGN